MENSGYIVAFIKFVKEKQHALTFLNGDLFCKPWIAFKEIEEKERGDKLELVASKLQTRLHMSSINRSYEFFLEDGLDAYTPVFCMYHLESSECSSTFRIQLENSRLKDFGIYAVVVNNTEEFIARVNQNLPGFSYGLIDYIDFKNRTVSSFRKPILKKDLSAFEHQREFRLYNTHYAITHEKALDDPSKEIILPNEAGAAFRNPKTGTKDDSMILNVLQEIAAFMNTNGGIVLVGVEDNGTIQGIDTEYAVANSQKQNWDGYLLNLTDRFRRLSIPNAAQYCKVEKHNLNGTDICQITIQPAPEDVHIEGKFFIREGNRKRELGVKEGSDYINRHWKK